MQALEAVANQLDIAYIASIEFGLALNQLMTQLVIQQLQQAGLPPGIAHMLTSLLTDQKRERVVHPVVQPVRVLATR